MQTEISRGLSVKNSSALFFSHRRALSQRGCPAGPCASVALTGRGSVRGHPLSMTGGAGLSWCGEKRVALNPQPGWGFELGRAASERGTVSQWGSVVLLLELG